MVDAKSGRVLLDLPTASSDAPWFMADGRALVSLDTPDNGTATVVDSATWHNRFEVVSGDLSRDNFADAGSGRLLVFSSSERAIDFIDVDKNRRTRILAGRADLRSGCHTAVGLGRRRARRQIAVVEPARAAAREPQGPPTSEPRIDSNILAVLDSAVLTYDESRTALVRTGVDGRRQASRSLASKDSIIAISASAGRIALGTSDGFIEILDARTLRVLRRGVVATAEAVEQYEKERSRRVVEDLDDDNPGDMRLHVGGGQVAQIALSGESHVLAVMRGSGQIELRSEDDFRVIHVALADKASNRFPLFVSRDGRALLFSMCNNRECYSCSVCQYGVAEKDCTSLWRGWALLAVSSDWRYALIQPWDKNPHRERPRIGAQPLR